MKTYTEDAIKIETGMDVFELWKHRFPDAPSDDPRAGGEGSCQGRDCQGQGCAWFGYGRLCGWCYEAEVNPFIQELLAEREE